MSYTYEYPRPCVAVDIVVFRQNGTTPEVLLIQRKFQPYKDNWAIPGGFINMDESLLETGERELAEETGLTGVSLQQLHTFGDLHRDPRARVISVVYYGITELNKSEVRGGDDAKQATWFPVERVPQLAFDHEKILEMAWNKIKVNGE